MEQKIISLIKQKDYVVPRDLAKQFNIDTTMAGAILSGLVEKKQICVSKTKIGGSPAYYSPDRRESLQSLYKYLNEKDKKAYDILKKERVVSDKSQPPLIRVALRNIRDFSVPLQVNLPSGPEQYWKWYLTSKQEAEVIIKSSLSQLKNAHSQNRIAAEKEETWPGFGLSQEPIKKVSHLNSETVSNHLLNAENQEKTAKKKIEELQTEIGCDSFLAQLAKYFAGKNIEIVSKTIIRKTLEIDLIIRIPSVVGKIEYYCKARNKKKCNDGDLSSAYVKGQLQKLPVLFLTPGGLTKKAQSMLNNEFKNNLIYKKLG